MPPLDRRSCRGQTPVERRTVLDGTVTLEDAPEIPAEVHETLRRYQNVRSAGLVDWTADGRGITIGTRFADVTQIHRVEMPGGARRQLTFYDEPTARSRDVPDPTRSCSRWTPAATNGINSGCSIPRPGRPVG